MRPTTRAVFWYVRPVVISSIAKIPRWIITNERNSAKIIFSLKSSLVKNVWTINNPGKINREGRATIARKDWKGVNHWRKRKKATINTAKMVMTIRAREYACFIMDWVNISKYAD